MHFNIGIGFHSRAQSAAVQLIEEARLLSFRKNLIGYTVHVRMYISVCVCVCVYLCVYEERLTGGDSLHVTRSIIGKKLASRSLKDPSEGSLPSKDTGHISHARPPPRVIKFREDVLFSKSDVSFVHDIINERCGLCGLKSAAARASHERAAPLPGLTGCLQRLTRCSNTPHRALNAFTVPRSRRRARGRREILTA